MKNLAKEMYDYHRWANEVIINRLRELPEDVYHKDIQSGFSSVSKVAAHIYLVDLNWFNILSGQNMKDSMAACEQIREELEMKSLDEMKDDYTDLSSRYETFLTDPENADKNLVVDNPYAGPLETNVYETILHIVTHGAYHRGNIATMLRQMGQTSVMQDCGLYQYSK